MVATCKKNKLSPTDHELIVMHATWNIESQDFPLILKWSWSVVQCFTVWCYNTSSSFYYKGSPKYFIPCLCRRHHLDLCWASHYDPSKVRSMLQLKALCYMKYRLILIKMLRCTFQLIHPRYDDCGGWFGGRSRRRVYSFGTHTIDL